MVVSRHKPAGQADLFRVDKSHKSILFYFLNPTYNCVFECYILASFRRFIANQNRIVE